MDGRRRPFRLRRPRLLLLLALACAGDEPEVVPALEADTAVAATDSAPSAPAAGSVLATWTDDVFPHRAHVDVACSACHGAMPGHTSHARLACTECHLTPTPGPAGTPTSTECAACHHASDRPQTCVHCHGSPPVPARLVPTTFRIAGRARGPPRALSFDHGRHTDLTCRTCHTGGVLLSVERTCATCHDDHHRATAQCSACHAAFPLATHDAAAHRTCAGVGCHERTAAFAPPVARNICLVCHREQVDHEPGGECRDCHRVNGGPP